LDSELVGRSLVAIHAFGPTSVGRGHWIDSRYSQVQEMATRGQRHEAVYKIVEDGDAWVASSEARGTVATWRALKRRRCERGERT